MILYCSPMGYGILNIILIDERLLTFSQGSFVISEGWSFRKGSHPLSFRYCALSKLMTRPRFITVHNWQDATLCFGRVSVTRAEGQVSANVQKLAALVSWVVGAQTKLSPPAPVGATAQVQKCESAPLRLGRFPPSPVAACQFYGSSG